MRFVEPVSGATYAIDQPRWCADDGAYVNLTPGPGLTRGDIVRERYSVWRYAAAIGVDDAHAVTMGEGWTPLNPGEWHGAKTLFKLEFMMPTGSFKDRGTTVMLSYLKSCGIERVLEDSSGNAGASLSAYAAAGGLEAAGEFDGRQAVMLIVDVSANSRDQSIGTTIQFGLRHALEPMTGAQPKVSEPVVQDVADRFVNEALRDAQVHEAPFVLSQLRPEEI